MIKKQIGKAHSAKSAKFLVSKRILIWRYKCYYNFIYNVCTVTTDDK